MKQCRIAVNSVINWSYFLLYLLFSIGLFPSNFIDSESGVTLCNQFPIRRRDTWRHSTCHSSLPPYWRSFGTKPLHSPALFGLLASNCIGVTTLTFRSRDVIGHVTIGLGMDHFQLVVLWTQVSISNGFRDIPPQTSWAHWQLTQC